jgi:hypothetical protein
MVTLGNAALRVVVAIAGASSVPMKLKADATYGTELALSVGNRRMTWLVLAHPAAPRVYQDAHASWCLKKSAARPSVRESPHAHRQP